MTMQQGTDMCAEASPQLVLRQFHQAESYNDSLNFYEMCRRNNRFYHGDQWHGLKTSRIQLMTSNFLQRPVSYFVSQIVSDDIGIDINPLIPGSVDDDAMEVLPDLVDRVFDRNDFYSINRDVIKQAAIECEGCLHWYWDADAETSQQARGDIRCERISTTNVLFGNPHDSRVQDQPYIIIKRRVPVQQMRERARALGCAAWQDIRADTNTQTAAGTEQSSEKDMCTELLKYWKVNRTAQRTASDGTKTETRRSSVHFCRIVGEVQVQGDTDTMCSLYPIARMVWNTMDGRYHGSCPMTSFIPTQITINRSLTLVCEFVKNFGLPKIFYKRGAFPAGLSNDPTRAYACAEDPSAAVYQIASGADVPVNIISLIDKLVESSRDFMGTSDSALGNIRPDNTSAIVATQKATAAPLMLQTMNFYQYVRECVRIVVDQIGGHYGLRLVRFDKEDDDQVPVFVDFSAVYVDEMDLKIEVGAASYWSELTAIQTMDNLVAQGFIPMDDPEAVLIYLESVPNGYIPNKQELVDYYRRRMESQQMSEQAEVIADRMAAQQDMEDIDAASAAQGNIPPEPAVPDDNREGPA